MLLENRYETLHLNENWNKKTRNRIEKYFHTNRPSELDGGKEQSETNPTHTASTRLDAAARAATSSIIKILIFGRNIRNK